MGLLSLGIRTYGPFMQSTESVRIFISGCPERGERVNSFEGYEIGVTEIPGGPERIVVGIDGSEASKAALAWVIDFARGRNISLQLIHAWTRPSYYGIFPAMGPDADVSAAVELLQRTTKTIQAAYSEMEIELTVREGPAGTTLVDASKGAVLLVVGGRGLGGFVGLMLGSVSTECVHRAHCPVLVFRIPDPVTTEQHQIEAEQEGRQSGHTHDSQGGVLVGPDLS